MTDDPPDARTVRPGQAVTYQEVAPAKPLAVATDLGELADRLKVASDQLGGLDERMNALIARIAQRVSVRVHVAIPIPGETLPTRFAWCKRDGVWGFAIERQHYEGGKLSIEPYERQSRWLRSRAPQLIRALLEAAPAQIAKMIEEREQALVDGEKLLGELEEP